MQRRRPAGDCVGVNVLLACGGSIGVSGPRSGDRGERGMTSQGRAHGDGRAFLTGLWYAILHKLLKLHCYDGGLGG